MDKRKCISPILTPIDELFDAKALYFKGEGFSFHNDEIVISDSGKIITNTYFNSLSVEKWRKYTNIEDLFLCIEGFGKVKLIVKNSYLAYDDLVTKILFVSEFELGPTNVVIDLSTYLDLEGILYFEIESNGRTIINHAGYYSHSLQKIPRMATVICTYKREKYINKYLERLASYKGNKNLFTFIIDNGNTLSYDTLPTNVTIKRNKNFGGASGFARGMLEVNRYNKNNPFNKIDYITLMDDDILVDMRIFDKLLAFLALRKEEYNTYFIAGTMCSLDKKNQQYERYASWRGNSFIQVSPNYDLSRTKDILKNELGEKLGNASAGWWFSCFSSEMLGENNYPFPCFFRGDDMEFTIRNKSNIMTLNGINVWHEPFYKKFSVVAENYYLLRNTLVINTLYINRFSAFKNIKYIFKIFSKSIVKYDYNSAELILKAWDDYSKGIDFFIETNAEQLNKELSIYNYKLTPLSQFLPEYKYEDINRIASSEMDSNMVSKILRFASFNGNLIPEIFFRNFSVSHIGYGSRAINFYRTKRVLNYDPFSRKGYITEYNFRKAVKLTFKFIKKAGEYYFRYESIKKNYQTEFYKLQTKSFWIKYLNISDEFK